MFLVKCTCGCFFTIKEESLTQYTLQCQNCKGEIPLLDVSNVLEYSERLSGSGFTVRAIPDNVKITVTFDA